jgi:hypothetical protein
MGVPTSEVGYTSATIGKGDHEVHKEHVVALGGGLNSWLRRYGRYKVRSQVPYHSCVNPNEMLPEIRPIVLEESF